MDDSEKSIPQTMFLNGAAVTAFGAERIGAVIVGHPALRATSLANVPADQYGLPRRPCCATTMSSPDTDRV